MKTDKVIQIGNYVPSRENVDNPQEGRIYDINGISPTLLATMAAGKMPKIIELNYKDYETSNRSIQDGVEED